MYDLNVFGILGGETVNKISILIKLGLLRLQSVYFVIGLPFFHNFRAIFLSIVLIFLFVGEIMSVCWSVVDFGS